MTNENERTLREVVREAEYGTVLVNGKAALVKDSEAGDLDNVYYTMLGGAMIRVYEQDRDYDQPAEGWVAVNVPVAS